MLSDEILASLHPLERAVLSSLHDRTSSRHLCNDARLDETSVLRALQWLEKKGLVKTSDKINEIAMLGKNGKLYMQKGLPERRLVKALSESALSLAELSKKAGLSEDEMSISIGVLKKKKWISLSKERHPFVTLTPEGVEASRASWPEEKLLEKLEHSPDFSSLSENSRSAFNELKSRKDIVRLSIEKERIAEITRKGSKARRALGKQTGAFEDRLTTKMLNDGSWKKAKFRHYDLTSQVPKVFGGKKQPYRRFLEEVRKKFIGLGFEELTGPIVETEFWNMDALFMPQFHSARDIHDGYYIKEPKYASSLPRELLNKVKAAHERGIKGSRGWRYEFDVKRSHRHLLRTQDTSISPRMLASPKLKVPGKYFQIVRCFRYDVIDSTHLPDFNQTGGFVVEEGINLRHLFGLLKLLAEEFCGTDKIKVVPAYFPFTEPSAALYAKHPDIGWIELAGSGIFRPEMCAPLGVKEPVIAWGLGVERLAMFNLGITDIRQLFSYDLQFLRNSRVV